MLVCWDRTTVVGVPLPGINIIITISQHNFKNCAIFNGIHGKNCDHCYAILCLFVDSCVRCIGLRHVVWLLSRARFQVEEIITKVVILDAVWARHMARTPVRVSSVIQKTE